MSGVQNINKIYPAYIGLTATDYLMPLGLGLSADRTPSTSARVTAMPFWVGTQQSFDRIGIYLTTAQSGAACRIGLYTNNGHGRPANLLADFGELDLSSGGGALKLLTSSFSFSGIVWALIWLKNVGTQVTLRGPSTIASVSMPSVDPGGSNSNGRWLALTAAYPASMPSTAPAVNPTDWTINDPFVLMRAA